MTLETTPAAEATAEVFDLIEKLHETDRRLEELTGGEVDAVANRRGQTVMLRRSQDQQRHGEALRQAAILNALPAHIALLDTQGVIVSVNEAWRKFGDANVLRSPGHAVGLNYLGICDRARGTGAAEASQVAQGIRAVLAGEIPSFSVEYACHAPGQKRWFLMAVTPLADGPLNGAVVMHLNITERKRAAQELRESERRFSELLQNVELAAVMLDREGCISFCNDYLLRLTGWRREEVMMRNWFDHFLAPGSRDTAHFHAAMQADHPVAWNRENEIVTRSGERRLMRWSNSVLRSGAGEVIGSASIGEDITEQKRSELRIMRLNRVYAMLSGINSLHVRVGEREDLFKEACRIAVEAGGFSMAWIGMLDREAMQIALVASTGVDEALRATIRQGLSLTDLVTPGNAVAARVILGKETVVFNDLAENSKLGFGKQHVASGILAIALFPLMVADEAVGVFALCAREVDFFHQEELALLIELSREIAFRIDHIEKRERLNYLAYYDVLTGLANRGLFLERLAQYMRGAAGSGHKLAVFLIDLSRFKNINDSLGQNAGDTLLKQVARWLTDKVADANLLARIGADHFALVLPEIRPDGDISKLMEKTMAAFLEHPFRVEDSVFRIAAKVGVALFPDDGDNADTVFKHAEAALKTAKARGERYLFYNQKMGAQAAGRVTLESQLRQALDKSEFVLHYQPKVNLANGKLVSAEALIRWNDPLSGLVPPGLFIPMLEETGLINEVGRWALRKAVEDYLRWRDAGLPAVRIAVNVSPLQLRHRDFIAEVEQIVGIAEQAADGLELEITESLIMEDVQHNIATLQAIRALGITIAIDDFGTGFSSLSYLARLPVDTLKIDRSFVNGMTVSPQGLALVSTIIDLAHALNLKVVAEGVETEEQSRLLRLLNCDEMQGFLFSKPLPVESFEAKYLAARTTGGTR